MLQVLVGESEEAIVLALTIMCITDVRNKVDNTWQHLGIIS